MWPNPQEIAVSVTFTEEILNGKLHFCAMFLTPDEHKNAFLHAKMNDTHV